MDVLADSATRAASPCLLPPLYAYFLQLRFARYSRPTAPVRPACAVALLAPASFTLLPRAFISFFSFAVLGGLGTCT